MTGFRIFIESNIWVYIFSDEDNYKADLAKKYIEETGRWLYNNEIM